MNNIIGKRPLLFYPEQITLKEVGEGQMELPD